MMASLQPSSSPSKLQLLPLELQEMIIDILFKESSDITPSQWKDPWKGQPLASKRPYLKTLLSLSSTCIWFRDLLAPRLFDWLVLQNTVKSAVSFQAIAKGKFADCVEFVDYVCPLYPGQ